MYLSRRVRVITPPNPPSNDEREFINFPLRQRVKSEINRTTNSPSMITSSICTRSIAAVIALSFAGFAARSASAQTTATTIPVGFITKTIPAAPDASTPSNTPLSIPLFQTADFQSSVASTPAAGSNVITLTAAAFTLNQFTTTPHLVRVKTGTLTGKFWTILSHDATSLTVNEPNGGAPGNLTGLVANDSCEILPANTLASVFGAPTPIPGLVGAASAGAADNVLLWNGTNFQTYFFNTNNTSWRSGLAASNNVIIFPDDAAFLVRKATSPLSVTIMGTVPSTNERTELIGSSNNFVANRFPTDSTLGTSGIETTPGWVKAGSASGADNVLLWNSGTGSWDTYFFHNTANVWRRGLAAANGTVIPAGTGFFIVRLAGTTDAVLTQTLPYTP